jgi:proline racemase
VDTISTTDYHTAGEPFRIVTGGLPEIPGTTVLDRRATLQQDEGLDRHRQLLVREPRGHADMYGCFIVPPNDDGARFGVLFWHKDGYSTACGHGTIALGAWAVESGLVEADPDGETEVVMDVPSGRVTAVVACVEGRVAGVTFRNIDSYVIARGVEVDLPHGRVGVDLAYGGAIYATVPAAAVGLRVRPQDVTELIAAGRAVKAALAGSPLTEHEDEARLSGVYATMFYDDLGDTATGPHQRNVTIFADGQVDRSPCGSGTSARLALLAAEGRLAPEQALRHDSIIGTTFTGRITGPGTRPGSLATEVTGTAHRVGRCEFGLDPADELGTGFVLR